MYYAAIEQDDKAIEYFKKALEFAEQEEIIQDYLGIAQSYVALQMNQEASKYYDLAIAEGESKNDRGSLVNLYYAKGMYLTIIDKYEDAKLCMEKGIQNAELVWGVNDIKVAEGYRNLSKIYVYESDYEAAYSYCRRAMDIYFNQEDTYTYSRNIAALYSNMGYLNMAFTDYSSALEMLEKSYNIVSKRMEDKEFSELDENILSANIKNLYDKTVGPEEDYETWFKENFEE